MEIVVQTLNPTADATGVTAPPGSSPESELLTNAEAAAFVRLSPRTLEKFRVLGGGPRYKKLGARVRYSVGDLRAWLQSRTFEMTSDPGLTQRASAR
jgi:hypothetical protein